MTVRGTADLGHEKWGKKIAYTYVEVSEVVIVIEGVPNNKIIWDFKSSNYGETVTIILIALKTK